MEHIKIEQNSNVEVVDSNIIHKLAEEAQDCDASSNMTGNLQTTNAYEDDVDFLMAKFSGLNINVTNGMYIRFEDPAVLSALITNNISSDGQGVTTTDALAVTNLNSLGLTNNSSITSFTELRQFKNITYAPGGFFSGCTNLEWIALPENNTNLGIGFQISGGKTLKWVVPNMEFACSRDFNAWYQHPGRGGGSDHVWTFYGLDKLPINDVVIPSGITTIGRYLFSKISCNSVTFPSGIEVIKVGAFENAQTILPFTINLSAATAIEHRAFYNCSSLTGDLVLPNLTNAEYDSFFKTGIHSVDFTGSSFSTIGTNMFNSCTNLTSVILPTSCTRLDTNSFLNCTSLTTINLSNITTFGRGCLNNCSSLDTSSINWNNVTILGGEFINVHIAQPNLIIPNLTYLGNWPFGNNDNSGVVSIDFTGSTFTDLSTCFMEGHTSFDHVIFPDTITIIKGYNHFIRTSTRWIKFLGTTIPSFEGTNTASTMAVPSTTKIYVPDSVVNDWKADANWSVIASQIFPMSQFSTDFPNG